MRFAKKTLLCLALSQAALLAVAEPLATEQPLREFPYTPSLDVSAMDRTADPCVDFYQFSCGGWIKNNPIPADQSSWDVYAKLAQDNQRYLWGILDGLASKSDGRNPAQQKIGDYFAACMNVPAVDALGTGPVQPMLDRIASLQSVKVLPALLADMHLQGGGAFFWLSADQDFANSSQVIAFAGAGGLGLPDRDYYLKADKKSVALRAKYLKHVENMLLLSGESAAAAHKGAASVMTIETALAKASLTNVERRDPYKLFHKVDANGLRKAAPNFGWDAYLNASGLGQLDTFNVTEPAFFKTVSDLLAKKPLGDIKTYLRWHAMHAAAPYLSTPLVEANFDFYGKTLRGIPAMQPRWKKCVQQVDGQLGDALAQEFVSRVFSPQLKDATLHMTQQIEDAMAAEIKALDWMSQTTKDKALEKLHGISNKIGYPDKWRDYSSVDIQRADYFGNVSRATLFETRRQLNKIGKPVDRSEWGMTAPTVNAYYSGQMNDINFPAGVLQPPLYDPKMDDAPNYGNTGGTIGHELTHGFDDQGRQFDATGNLKDWWTKADADAFKQRAQCVSDQYSSYTAIDDIKVNGKLTNGEDIADLGGIVLALIAWKAETAGKTLENRDGLTPEQRFFVGNAQWACGHYRPETARLLALTDPHSPLKYRVNGLVANIPEFEKAFACKKGQPMVNENRCRIW